MDGYVLLYAINSRSSFDKLEFVHEKLLNLIGADNIPRVLVGNKSDLDSSREVGHEEGKALAEHWGVPFLECSAKIGYNISESCDPVFCSRCTCRGVCGDVDVYLGCQYGLVRWVKICHMAVDVAM